MADVLPNIRNERKTRSKSRSASNGKPDPLVTRTTQVYESQWEVMSTMSALRGESVATLVRAALDAYITESALRPRLMAQLKSMFQAEVSQVVGEHLKLSDERARTEILATQSSLNHLVEILKPLIGNMNKEVQSQGRELDQVVAFLVDKKVDIKRG